MTTGGKTKAAAAKPKAAKRKAAGQTKPKAAAKPTAAAQRKAMPRPVPADADGKLSLTLQVNGREHVVRARPHHTLLDVLRTELGLTGPREGCGVGMCGACTVLFDGRPVSGCLVLAPLAEGVDIVTIEGLEAADGTLHPVQQAYVDHTAFQCSYCTPGFILTTKALLDEQPNPSRDEAIEYLAGNLCRCGSYVKILDAVMDAGERVRTAG